MSSAEINIKRWIKPEIQALKAYHVADASGMIKLDAMENPYPWPEDLKADWLTALSKAQVNRYPDPQAHALRKMIRQTQGIRTAYDILLGNGSDELIQLLILAVQNPQYKVLAPTPTFVMYELLSRVAGMSFIGIDCLPSLQLDKTALLSAITQHQPALIFIAQPNNPTGQIYPLADLREILQAAQGLVVIDEAYAPFTAATALPLLDEFDNVLVLRTFSKMGLAGLRLGYLVGQPAWIAQLEKLRLPYNINSLTQISMEFALQHYDRFLQQTQLMCEQRAWLIQQLKQNSDFQIWDSEANFVLVKCLKQTANAVFEQLKQQKILVKNLHGAHPLLENCLRFSIGTPTENQKLMEAI